MGKKRKAKGRNSEWTVKLRFIAAKLGIETAELRARILQEETGPCLQLYGDEISTLKDEYGGQVPKITGVNLIKKLQDASAPEPKKKKQIKQPTLSKNDIITSLIAQLTEKESSRAENQLVDYGKVAVPLLIEDITSDRKYKKIKKILLRLQRRMLELL
jgi:hypothetical protein